MSAAKSFKENMKTKGDLMDKGFVKVPNCLIDVPKEMMSSTDKLVYSVILDYVHDKKGWNRTCPKQGTIARRIGKARKTVNGSIKRLKDLGLLESERTQLASNYFLKITVYEAIEIWLKKEKEKNTQHAEIINDSLECNDSKSDIKFLKIVKPDAEKLPSDGYFSASPLISTYRPYQIQNLESRQEELNFENSEASPGERAGQKKEYLGECYAHEPKGNSNCNDIGNANGIGNGIDIAIGNGIDNSNSNAIGIDSCVGIDNTYGIAYSDTPRPRDERREELNNAEFTKVKHGEGFAEVAFVGGKILIRKAWGDGGEIQVALALPRDFHVESTQTTRPPDHTPSLRGANQSTDSIPKGASMDELPFSKSKQVRRTKIKSEKKSPMRKVSKKKTNQLEKVFEVFVEAANRNGYSAPQNCPSSKALMERILEHGVQNVCDAINFGIDNWGRMSELFPGGKSFNHTPTVSEISISWIIDGLISKMSDKQPSKVATKSNVVSFKDKQKKKEQEDEMFIESMKKLLKSNEGWDK